MNHLEYNQTQRELRQRLGKISNEMTTIAQRSFSNSGDRERFDEIEEDSRQIDLDLERLERSMGMSVRMNQTAPPPHGDFPGVGRSGRNNEDPARGAFDRYLRHGATHLSDEDRSLLQSENRAMGVGPDGGAFPASGGSYLVPVGFQSELEVAVKTYSPLLAGTGNGRDRFPRILPTATGNLLPWPSVNDTGNVGELLAEGSSTGSSVEPSVSQQILGAYKFSSKLVLVNRELLQDNAVQLENVLGGLLGERIGRAANVYLTTGSGTAQPQGIVTGATLGATAAGAGTNDGSSLANTIGTDDMISLEHSVDPAYRTMASWMMHDTTLASLKKLKDKQGYPIWLPAVADNAPATIFGYPYIINNDMDQLQTQVSSPVVTRKTVLFGDFSKFIIRRVQGYYLARLTELYAGNDQIGFIAFARLDSRLIDAGTHPIKYLKNVY